MKKIIVSVTSDLVTDQRVHKVAQTLQLAGYDVTVFGRKKRKSKAVLPRIYKVKRTRLFFEKGFLFYACYNIRLFFYLLFSKADVLLSNDLDTLLPNFLISRIKKLPLIFDAHEYFTGVPELINRPMVRKIWKKIEQYLLPKITSMYTVNQSIANLYTQEYGIIPLVVRNLPLPDTTPRPSLSTKSLEDHYWEVPVLDYDIYIMQTFFKAPLEHDTRKIILYQGAINKDRGISELMDAMEYISGAVFLIVGSGDEFKLLQAKLRMLPWKENIMMIGQVPFERLGDFTRLATLGVSVEKPTNINYRLASPNKVVDYIHHGVPVLASRLVETERLITQYEVGGFIDNHEPGHMATRINEILNNHSQLDRWKTNCLKAAAELTWESEATVLLKVLDRI